jgi:hypothetical protein
MRYITLAAVTLAGVVFAGAAYADSNNGPRQKGDQCWHRQLGDSLGYWAPCRSAEAEAVRQRLLAAGRSAEEADREAERTGARATQATRTNAQGNANNNTRKK